MKNRNAEINRKTNETDIKLKLNMDGTGKYKISTGIGFMNHMLELFSRHGRFDIELNCDGDTHIDDHHSAEDIGIVLGRAFKEALGDMRGIERYGSFYMPMDETLVLSAVDLSGRSFLKYDVSVPNAKIGSFDTELIEEFFAAFTRSLGITLHIKLIHGENSHHISEAVFKGTARALKQAVKIDAEFQNDIPSTKGVLL